METFNIKTLLLIFKEEVEMHNMKAKFGGDSIYFQTKWGDKLQNGVIKHSQWLMQVGEQLSTIVVLTMQMTNSVNS